MKSVTIRWFLLMAWTANAIASSDLTPSKVVGRNRRTMQSLHGIESGSRMPGNEPTKKRKAMSSLINEPEYFTRSLRGGGAAASTSNELSKQQSTTLNALHQTSFLIVVSISIVAFAPLPSITRHLTDLVELDDTVPSKSPQSQAIQILSILSSISATIELFASPLIGIWIDSLGRKMPTIILYSLIVLSNAVVVLHPSVWSISLSKITNGVVGGFLVIITNAIIADVFANSSKDAKDQMGSIFGRQAAAVSMGFLSGSLIGGRLTEGGERLAYGCSLIFSLLATMTGVIRLKESVEFSSDKNANGDSTHRDSWDHEILKQKLLEAPLSSLQLLFYYGTKMRTLSLLLMLQSAPMYMGDVFQLFAKEYWSLNPSTFGQLIALFGVLGIISNLSLPVLLNKLGLRNFSLLAILSSFLFPVTTIFSSNYRPVLIAGCIGLYGGCQKIGTSTTMTSLATEMGVKQGQLQGEKASMLALLRIICPVLYGSLYLKGKEWGLHHDNSAISANLLSLTKRTIGTKLPFVLNIILSILALYLAWKNI